MKSQKQTINPAQFIKTVVIPKDLSVTEAANLLKVSRVTLSRFLNGKASLSESMAKKISIAFDYPLNEILEVLNNWKNAQTKEKPLKDTPRSYVPRFLGFKATDLEQWANQTHSRERFPVFIRTLIHSTTPSISSISIPGNDHSQEHGFDGIVSTLDQSTWVPLGDSYWELGTGENPQIKASKDFKNSLKKCDKEQRMQSTFIFVTPRNWPGKKKWETEVNELNEWKKVLVYDAETLEEWLEQSLAGQIWLSDELDYPYQDLRLLRKYWEQWSTVTTPPLDSEIYLTASKTLRQEINKYFKQSADIKPLHIKTNNINEALALLYLAFPDEELIASRHPVVINSEKHIDRIFESNTNLLSILFTENSIKAFLPYCSKVPCIILCTPDFFELKQDNIQYLDLPKPKWIDIDRALIKMGLSDSQASNFIETTGKSIPALRRKLTKVELHEKPWWYENEETQKILLPLFFIGKWQLSNSSDQKIISALSDNLTYQQIEKKAKKLSKISDAPCWMGKDLGKIISRDEILFIVVKQFLDEYTLSKVFAAAEKILTDIISKKQNENCSKFLVTGFFSSLALLADNINELASDAHVRVYFQQRVEKLLDIALPSPLSEEHLGKIDSYLELITEIAPTAVLDRLSPALVTANKSIVNFKPSKNIFSKPPHLGLIRSLEKLVWIRKAASQSIQTLVALAEPCSNGNYENSPLRTLKYVFNSIYPQTGLKLEELFHIFKRVKESSPDVAWQLCISILNCHIAQLTSTPLWIKGTFRGLDLTDGKERQEYLERILDESIHWNTYTPEMLNSLLDSVSKHGGPEEMDKVWQLIDTWAINAKDEDKILVQEKIRNIYLSQQHSRANKFYLSSLGETVYEKLGTNDPYLRNLWLFKQYCPNVKISDSQIDFCELMRKQQEYIEQKRKEVLINLISQDGYEAIFNLLSRDETEQTAGTIAEAAAKVFDENEAAKVAIMFTQKDKFHANNIASRFLRSLLWSHEQGTEIYLSYLQKNNCWKFSVFAPFKSTTWNYIKKVSPEAQKEYWTTVGIDIFAILDDIEDVIENLFKVNRLKQIINLIEYQYKNVRPQTLFKVLISYAYQQENSRALQESFSFREMVVFLIKSSELRSEEKAILEAYYCHCLSIPYSRDDHKVRLTDLEKLIENNPKLFAYLCQERFHRNQKLDDFSCEGGYLKYLSDAVSKNAFNILALLRHIPGTDQQTSKINFNKTIGWINQVRNCAASENEIHWFEFHIGSLLANSSLETSDEVWPSYDVCQLIEELHLEYIALGFVDYFNNSQGPHWVSEQFTANCFKNAEHFENLADNYCVEFSFVSESIFRPIAAYFRFNAKHNQQTLEYIDN